MMKRIISTMLILWSMFWPIVSLAQYTQTIRGEVIDMYSEQPLPGANILLLGEGKGTITDIDGKFRLEHVPVGRQNLQVSFIGYNTIVLNNLNVSSGKELVLNLKMEEKVETTEAVVVTARKKTETVNEMAMVSSRSFTIEETERFAGALGDPSRMVANYAGVLSVSDERNDIIIRGNSPAGLLWRIDGVEVPNPNHFASFGSTGGPVSMLNNNLLTNSDFYTGAFPAEYGNALSGAFDLHLRNGNNQQREHVFQVGFNGFELGTEGPFVKGRQSSYLVNYRYSTLELMSELGFDFGTGTAIPEYQDLSFKLNFLTDKGRLSVFGIGGLSAIHFAADEGTNDSYGTAGTDLDYITGSGVMAASYLHFFNDKTRLFLSFSSQARKEAVDIDSMSYRLDGLDTVGISTHPFYRSQMSDSEYTIKMEIKSKQNARNNLSIGAVYHIYHINYKDSIIDPDRPDPSSYELWRPNTDIDGYIYMLQAFGQWQHRFTDQLTAYTGLHNQLFTLNNSFAVEPRLALKWQFMPKHSVNLGFGLHSQMQPRQLYYYKTNIYDQQGDVLGHEKTNEELGFSRSMHYVAGYDYMIGPALRLKAEAYYQYLYDIPIRDERTAEAGDDQFFLLNGGDNFGPVMVDSLVNEGTGENYGVELTLEKFFNKQYYFLLTTSLFESKYVGRDGVKRNTAFNGNFVVNALVGYEKALGANNTLGFNIKTVWAGGKRYVPIIAEQSSRAEVVYDWSEAYADRYDDYLKVDLRINFKMNRGRFSQEFAIDLMNLTNNENIMRRRFNGVSGEVETDYQTGFYPMFLYRLNF